MEKLFSTSPTSLLLIALSCFFIYISVIILTRIFGKRSFSKMSSFDFAMTVAIGSVIASVIMTQSLSVTEGAFGLLIIYSLQMMAAYFRRFEFFKKAIDNSPLLLMDGNKILTENLKKARVTEGDLRSKLREANVIDLDEVRAVIFEATGDMIVLHAADKERNLDKWLLKDVKRN
ncbi:DUF421 domain-containing protein [Aequorivita echinoideorum]|uniref:DUF421 domain-containing protein n=1 Tax=Aequorivita echinoideorum TaxID=1549647 RepID=A0ABS5S8S0_9FLAO|nr:YetF domain-containing protein [Aequorivita echinoideorum]MBT0608820.1 DUF421 domain-containing protein [Aequorivita echinoideorum]